MNKSEMLLFYNYGKADVIRNGRNGKLVMKNGKVLDEKWWKDKINIHQKWLKKKRRNYSDGF